MSIPLIDMIEPKNGGSFPMFDTLHGLGGNREVADNTARDAIPAARRRDGMLCYVQSTGFTYRLLSDLTSWTLVTYGGGVATANITVAVSTSGNDSDAARPTLIIAGDWSAYPFATLKGARDALAKHLGEFTVTITVGAGNFTGCVFSGFTGKTARGAFRLFGTWQAATLTAGSNAFTAGSGTSAASLKKDAAAANWTVDELRTMFARVTSGTGYVSDPLYEAFAAIESNTTDTATLVGSGIANLADTSVVQICRPATIINAIAEDELDLISAGTYTKVGLAFTGFVADIAVRAVGFDMGATTANFGLYINGCARNDVAGVDFDDNLHFTGFGATSFIDRCVVRGGASVRTFGSNSATLSNLVIDGGQIWARDFRRGTIGPIDAKSCSSNAVKVEDGGVVTLGVHANDNTATPVYLRTCGYLSLGSYGLTGANAGTTYALDVGNSGAYNLAGATMTGSGSYQVSCDGRDVSWAMLAASGVHRKWGTNLIWGSGREALLNKIYVPVNAADPGDEIATDGDLVVGGQTKNFGLDYELSPAADFVNAAGSDLAGATLCAYRTTVVIGGTGGVKLRETVNLSGTGDDIMAIMLVVNRSGAAINLYPTHSSGTLNGGSAGTPVSIPNGGAALVEKYDQYDAYVTVVGDRTALGAAASGANADITGLSAIAAAIVTSHGGITSNVANGASAIGFLLNAANISSASDRFLLKLQQGGVDRIVIRGDSFLQIFGGPVITNTTYFGPSSGHSISSAGLVGLGQSHRCDVDQQQATLDLMLRSARTMSSGNKAVRVGTSVADGSVNADAKLLSVNTAMTAAGSGDVEKAYVKKSGMYHTAADIGTAPSGTGITVNETGAATTKKVHKVTVTEAALTDADTQQDITIWTLPAKSRPIRVIADTAAAFTGGGNTAVALEVGISGNNNGLLLSHDIFTAPVTKGLVNADLGTLIANAASDIFSWSATTAIIARFTSTTGTVAGLTAGSVTFTIEYETYP